MTTIATKLAAIRQLCDAIEAELVDNARLEAIDARLTRNKADSLIADRLDAHAGTLDAMQRRLNGQRRSLDDLTRRVADIANTLELVQTLVNPTPHNPINPGALIEKAVFGQPPDPIDKDIPF